MNKQKMISKQLVFLLNKKSASKMPADFFINLSIYLLAYALFKRLSKSSKQADNSFGRCLPNFG